MFLFLIKKNDAQYLVPDISKGVNIALNFEVYNSQLR